MDKLKPSNTTLAAIITTAVVCFCAFMAYQQWFAPVQIEMDSKYIRERQELEAKAQDLAAEVAALEDSATALLDTIAILKQQPTQIQRNHEDIRTANWQLPADSASALLRARLAAEDTHRLRFVYRTYTD